MQGDDLQQAIEEIHGRFAAQLDEVLAIHLPDATDRRFRRFFDELGLSERPIPNWVMSFYHVQEALMAAYYHRGNIARIEGSALNILRTALGEESHPLPPTNMAIGAFTLAAEYQAYLVAVRRAFEYLARGVARLFGVPPPGSFVKLPKALEKAGSAEAAGRLSKLVQPVRDELKDAFSRRNILAHEEPVPAGQFQIVFSRGNRAEIALVETGEEVHHLNWFGPDEPRLAAALGRQLAQVENRVFEFIAALPEGLGSS
jgi:hypothetical protein